LTLNDLRSRLAPFAAGDWFELHDDEIGWRGSKSRPCMLIEMLDTHPISLVRPRTTTGRDGRFHPRHPPRHAPRCQIDKAGRLPEVLLRVRTTRLCHETFRCHEPDAEFLESILPRHLR
jgi:hypothetical protein